jgi:hypothetical protein
MWNTIISIATWLIGLVSSPYVAIAVQGITAMSKSLPDGFLSDVIAAIVSANSNTELDTGPKMFAWVYATIKAKYPGVAENTLRAAIEVYVGAGKRGMF